MKLDESTTTTTSDDYGQHLGRMFRVQADGPRQWRDRIHAIDAEIHELNAAHTAAVEAREEERIALVQRLELEGLQLTAAKAQPVEDDSDWSTWKAGDIVECLTSISPGRQFTEGNKYVLRDDFSALGFVGVVADDKGASNGTWQGNFKLHARAAK